MACAMLSLTAIWLGLSISGDATTTSNPIVSENGSHHLSEPRRFSQRTLMIPVIQGVATLDTELLRTGGRLVIGVPSPAHQRIEIRIEPALSVPANPQQAALEMERVEVMRGTQAFAALSLDVHPLRTRSQLTQIVYTENPASPPTRRSFRFPHFNSLAGDQSLGLIDAELLATGKRSVVYVDRRDRDLPHLKILSSEIVRLIDDEVLDLIESRIWPIADLDRNGKFTLLLSSEMIRVSPSQQFAAVPLKGMTWSEDYSSIRSIGNNADVVYLHPHLQADQGLKSLLLHELAHAACFSRAFHAPNSDGKLPPDWISEGIAHLAETWENNDRSNWESRVQAFEQGSRESPLLIDVYSRAGLWRHPGSRGAVISFFHWLAQREPEDFVHQWFAAAQPSRQGLETAQGREIKDLFRGWSADTARNWNSFGLTHLDGDALHVTLRGSTFSVVDLEAQEHPLRITFPEAIDGQVTLLPAE